MASGIVFNIQGYSLHDGPGIRTTVFLKGCPLRCIWCSNPESQSAEPQLYFDRSKCIYKKGCRSCGEYFTSDELSSGRPDLDKSPQAASVCPSGAINVYGKEMTADEVICRVERDSVFYRSGEGGMTLSGGEPFFQGEFAIELLKEAKKRFIHTAAETCGFCDTDILREAAEYLDYIMYDLKIIDEEKHIKYTGASNRLILKNLKMLFKEFPDIPKLIRTPVIPSVNDNEEDISAVRSFLSGFDGADFELLPYHRFGKSKYEMLGLPYPKLPERLDKDVFARLKKL